MAKVAETATRARFKKIAHAFFQQCGIMRIYDEIANRGIQTLLTDVKNLTMIQIRISDKNPTLT